MALLCDKYPCRAGHASLQSIFFRCSISPRHVFFPKQHHRRRLCTITSEAPQAIDRYQAPIPGAVTFKRSRLQTHHEFQTTLERLGLSKLSSDLSRSMALSMGLRIANGEEAATASSTPVIVSIDESPEGRNLRLDGILRTAIALPCYRCLGSAAEQVFANFSLLLTDEPVVSPTQMKSGVSLGYPNGPRLPEDCDEKDQILDLDLDDMLHFPRHEQQIDISKYIRDTVHLEIPFRALCNPNCKGLCRSCRANLNTDSCECQSKIQDLEKKARNDYWSPLQQLKMKMEKQELK